MGAILGSEAQELKRQIMQYLGMISITEDGQEPIIVTGSYSDQAEALPIQRVLPQMHHNYYTCMPTTESMRLSQILLIIGFCVSTLSSCTI